MNHLKLKYVEFSEVIAMTLRVEVMDFKYVAALMLYLCHGSYVYICTRKKTLAFC